MKMSSRAVSAACLLFALVFVVSSLGGCAYSTVQRMTPAGLYGIVDNPDVVIVDVRSDRDWDASNEKIRGAVREDSSDVESWASKYPKHKTVVVYCA